MRWCILFFFNKSLDGLVFRINIDRADSRQAFKHILEAIDDKPGFLNPDNCIGRDGMQKRDVFLTGEMCLNVWYDIDDRKITLR